MAADLVAAWRAGQVPAAVRSAAGLRSCAETLVSRAQAEPGLVGWMMVTIVSEYWRDRLAGGRPGRRLLLLPDCPAAASRQPSGGVVDGMPLTCGPGCGIATVWSAARDGGWVVEPVRRAVAGIGGLLTGQFDGALGIATLADLEKAFAMIPAFSLPIAAVPYEPPPRDSTVPRAECGCCGDVLESQALDVDWLLGLVGVAGGGAAPVGDYLPLLHEAADLFLPERLAALGGRLGLGEAFGSDAVDRGSPLDATAAMSVEFLTRGGKFLRPFICLAAFDAVRGDLAGTSTAADRDAVKAAAVAIEIFHKASLVHDDIEDSDGMRYGRPTLHVEQGVPAAINSGDYLLGLGYRLIASLPGVDGDTVRDLVTILSDAHVRLARGQGAELCWRDGADKRLGVRDALEIYALKTSPAFEAAIAMGVRLAGVSPREAGDIAAFARHCGTGFQILNDLKDWRGDLENDRRAAGDVLGGRPTVMWSLALERLSAADADRLAGLARSAGRVETGEDDVRAGVAEARGLYAAAGVVERAVGIVAEQRRLAAAAAAGCLEPRFREVLEFMLDLAVPEQVSGE